MAPRKQAKKLGKKLLFTGPGRVLGTGEVVAGKRPSGVEDKDARKKQRIDDEYTPEVENETSSGDDDLIEDESEAELENPDEDCLDLDAAVVEEDVAEEEIVSDEESDPAHEVEDGGDSDYDTIEVRNVDGTIERVPKPAQMDDEQDNEEIKRKLNIKEDNKHVLIGKRRKARMAIVIYRAEENAKIKDFKTVEATDDKIDRKDKPKLIVCKVGGFEVTGYDKAGKPSKVVQLSKEDIMMLNERDEMDGDNSPCECEVCVKRRGNAIETASFARGSTRSGAKRGMWKYGEGHRLGEAGKKGEKAATAETS